MKTPSFPTTQCGFPVQNTTCCFFYFRCNLTSTRALSINFAKVTITITVLIYRDRCQRDSMNV